MGKDKVNDGNVGDSNTQGSNPLPNIITGWIVVNGEAINLNAYRSISKGCTKDGKHHLTLKGMFIDEVMRCPISTEKELDVIYSDICRLLNAPVHDPEDTMNIRKYLKEDSDVK